MHVDHGIARFVGLQTIMAAGAPHDCLELHYAESAKLYLPVENIELLSRYGSEEAGVQLDRLDFPRPDAPWLFVLFSSQTCDSCAPMAARVAALDSDTVATVEVEASADKELHRRYRIEGVPMVVLADADGVVRAGFVGSVDAWELEEALATARGGEPA